MIKFLPLGGASEVGASCHYLSFDDTGVLLDCGIHPQKAGIEALPAFDLLNDLPLDAALISHAHQDHIAALPYLVQRHPYVRIVSTPQTRGLAELTLHNAVAILQEQPLESDSVKSYSHEEVDLLIQSIEWRAYGEPLEIVGYREPGARRVHGTFWDAGHILGSAGTLLEYEGTRIFYSGDTSLREQMLEPAASLPDGTVDVLILECTHGATEPESLPEWTKESRRFAQRANVVIERGGAILVPVFALGKLQEMLASVAFLMERGLLSSVPIYTGGIGRKINAVYDKNRYVVPRKDPERELGAINQTDLYAVTRIEELFEKPAIILASSGMIIEGTLSYRAARLWLDQSDCAIFTVGYMDPGTPGYKLLRTERGGTIRLSDSEEERRVQCDIERFRFTAHADRLSLLDFVTRLRPERVILVHGDGAAVDWMGHAILSRHPRMRAHAAAVGTMIEID